MRFWDAVRTGVVLFGFGVAAMFVLIESARLDQRNFVRSVPVVCKVCHCGKEKCASVCSEENMCAMRCEKECGKKR